MHRSRSEIVTGLVVLALAAAGCGAASVRYPRRPIVWADDDRVAFAPRPEERWVPYYWDAADHLIFRPAAEVWWLELPREAIDVNAIDEVPDSSFFVNRIGRRAMSPEEVALGACTAEELATLPPAPWTIIGGKPDGASPGFVIRDANGVRYLMKTDRADQPERSTAADPIVAAIFHAAGFHVPCNRVAYFDPSWLVIEPGARTSRSVGRRPIQARHVARVVAAAAQPDGRHRVMLSRYVEGEPLGPWDYVGTWSEDPNDVVPHERRRELRGQYVLDAWVDHWDARQANTLSAWIASGEGGYVRHYMVDFGEALGMIQGNHRQAPRMGHSTFLDVGDVALDTLGLGIVSRPWDGREPEPVLGYFDVEHFSADGWRPQYWNGALDRRTERDDAWMARILARFTDEHVHALAALGRYSDPAVQARLEQVLRGRRDLLLERYLTRLSPLAEPAIEQDGARTWVCAIDLAIASGIRDRERRRVRASIEAGASIAPAREIRADGARVCVELDERAGDYAIVDVAVATEGAETARSLRIHVDLEGPPMIVGAER